MGTETLIIVGALIGMPVINILVERLLKNDDRYIQKEICIHLRHIAEALGELKADHKKDVDRIIDRLNGGMH